MGLDDASKCVTMNKLLPEMVIGPMIYFLFLMLLSKIFSRVVLCASLLSPLHNSPAHSASSRQCGETSFYGGHGDGYAWRTMANGRLMDPSAMTTAHPYFPFGTKLKVTNQDNGKVVIVTTTDRGPYAKGRILDLSLGAFSKIASPSSGVARICFAKL